ncbi:MAG: histidine triad nucleotide-binding protein [Patescibacteria group bacterium]|jgi:histidine triad (HIT) family protein
MACIFCKIINKEIPAKVRFEDDKFLAFDDIYPKAKVHILLVTKEHFSSLDQTRDRDNKLLGDMLLTARKIAHENGLKEGYRLIMNVGKKGGQEVPHIHLHILGDDPLGDII